MSRKILLKKLPTTDPERILEVEVYYDEGGLSYLTGGVSKRGYYLAVQPVKLDDLACQKLARDIANRLENELKYPGEIKVHVIRETRVIEYAR